MKLVYISAVILSLVLIVGYFLTIYVLPYAIIKPPRVSLEITPKDFNLNSKEIEVTVEEELVLKGHWIYTSQENPKGLIIFVHGIGGCKEHYFQISKEMAEAGVESVVFDSRAHGESQGEYCTYGAKEKLDVIKLVDFVKKENPNIKIGIWGNSMGGAIAIQALEIEKRIEFGIIESTFCELSEVIFDYQKRFTQGIGIRPMTDLALEKAGEIGGFNPQLVSPLSSVKHIDQSIFIAHGDADANISVNYGRELFHALKSIDKELEIVEGGEHYNLQGAGGIEYSEKVMNFILRNL